MEILTILVLFLSIGFLIGSNFLLDSNENIPSVKLSNLNGSTTNSQTIISGNQPIIVVFWKPSESTFADQFAQMLEARKQIMGQKQSKIIAICENADQISTKLKQEMKQYLMEGKTDIEVYIDKFGDMRSELHIPEVPFTMVFDKDQKMDFNFFGLNLSYRKKQLNGNHTNLVIE